MAVPGSSGYLYYHEDRKAVYVMLCHSFHMIVARYCVTVTVTSVSQVLLIIWPMSAGPDRTATIQ